jgi:hypothetical protein
MCQCCHTKHQPILGGESSTTMETVTAATNFVTNFTVTEVAAAAAPFTFSIWGRVRRGVMAVANFCHNIRGPHTHR